LMLVVNQLPPKCRKVLLLRMLEGLSQKEIATRLGIAVSTVEKHLAKALHSSRDAMAELKRSSMRSEADAGVLRSARS
jgi:RNA polymerase sigma factor (sigma-70 family)